MKFNINQKVRVKLTDFGRKLHRDNYDRLFHGIVGAPDYQPPDEDSEGWSTWELWVVMQQFGRGMVMGGILPIETAIEITDEEGTFEASPETSLKLNVTETETFFLREAIDCFIAEGCPCAFPPQSESYKRYQKQIAGNYDRVSEELLRKLTLDDGSPCGVEE